MKPWSSLDLTEPELKQIIDIREKALKSLKDEFHKAAITSSSNFMTWIEASAENPIHRNDGSYNRKLNTLQFLFNGSNGRYQAASSFSSDPYDLWGDYLQSIGRLTHGFASYPRNSKIIKSLIKQNGPKKMEQRLTAYLRRRIKDAKKSCADPNP